MVKARELRELDDGDLAKRISEAKEELFRLRMQHATLQLNDTSRLGALRRDVARMLTVRRERVLIGGDSLQDEG